MISLVAICAFALAGCGDDCPPCSGLVDQWSAGSHRHHLPGEPEREFTTYVPHSYVPGRPLPLVISLHGYGQDADIQRRYFDLERLAESEGFVVVRPNGTIDESGLRFWNATDACCDVDFSGVDDVAYVMRVIDETMETLSIDEQRISILGVSAGAFMAHRLACDHSDRIASVVSVSGADWSDHTRCQPTGPVNILEVHGTADVTIPYEGGEYRGVAVPSTLDVVSRWAGDNGCRASIESDPTRLDLAIDVDGAETTVERFVGCPLHGNVELWKIIGGSHVPGHGPGLLEACGRVHAHASQTVMTIRCAAPNPIVACLMPTSRAVSAAE